MSSLWFSVVVWLRNGGKKEDGLSLPSVLPSTFPHGWDPALLSHLCAVEAEGSVLCKYKAGGCGCVLCVSSLCILRLEHAMFAVQQQYRFPLQLNTLKCWWEEGPNELFFFRLGVLDCLFQHHCSERPWPPGALPLPLSSPKGDNLQCTPQVNIMAANWETLNDPTLNKTLRASPYRETVLAPAYWDLSRGQGVRYPSRSPFLPQLSRPLIPVCSSDQRLLGNTSVPPLHGCCQLFAFHMLQPCYRATDMTVSKQVQLIKSIWPTSDSH